MYCGQCGTENSEDAEVCSLCGVTLTQTAGSRICVECGANVGDLDPFCMSCGAKMSEQGVRFEAGPSFVDDSDLEYDRDDLPPWLRDVVDEREGTSPEPESADDVDLEDLMTGKNAGQPPEKSASKPATSPAPVEPAQGSTQHNSAADFNLISDEDLPDWLRDLGVDDEPPAPAEHSVTAGSAAPSALDVEQSLQINRAWKPAGRRVDEMAVSNAQNQFAVTGTLPVLDDPAPGQSTSGSIALGEDASQAGESPEFTVATDDEAAQRTKRIRVLLLLLAIAVLLLLLLMIFTG